MTDLKNLTDEQLLDLIDNEKIESQIFIEIKALSKQDPEFRYRLVELKIKNKSDQKDSRNGLIETMKSVLAETNSPELKAKLQKSIETLSENNK